jgi:hypothetical protein
MGRSCAGVLGTHYEAGALGRELRDKSRSWMNKNFESVAAEPAFLQLPVAEVVALVEPDELEAKEEEVFAAVMAWVKESEVVRKRELDRLLPLVRFPMMAKPGPAIMAEPLVVGLQPLGMQLLFELTKGFAESEQAAACPRLRPRKGQLPAGAFVTVWSGAIKHENIVLDGDLVARNTGDNGEGVWSAAPLPSTGQHFWEVTFTKPGKAKGACMGGCYLVGVQGENVTPEKERMYKKPGVWALTDCKGEKRQLRADGQGVLGNVPRNAEDTSYSYSERVGVLADMDARPRTLQFFRDGQRLEGAVVSGFPEGARLIASPFNAGTTATLAFPGLPAGAG